MNAHAVNIIKKLKEAGHEAVLAGGVVRDMLLGVKPKDFDIATSAKPEQVEALFEKTVAVGKAFGVIRVLVEDEVFEVATFREDSRESDGRRPNSVSFANMEGDALRRDFTINGMFYDPIEEKLFDFVGGQEDLRNKTLRFIGNPEDRIKEDALRILRFYRFAFRLDLEPDAVSRFVISQKTYLLSNVSKERIHEELTKILSHRNAHKAMQALLDDGIFDAILPEVASLNNCNQDFLWHPEGWGAISFNSNAASSTVTVWENACFGELSDSATASFTLLPALTSAPRAKPIKYSMSDSLARAGNTGPFGVGFTANFSKTVHAASKGFMREMQAAIDTEECILVMFKVSGSSVKPAMLGYGHGYEIFWSIVELVSVYVVNLLASQQGSAELSLHNQSVQSDIFPMNNGGEIASVFVDRESLSVDNANVLVKINLNGHLRAFTRNHLVWEVSLGNVFHHTKLMFEKGAESVHGNPVLAWGILLHDIAKPRCFKIEDGRITAKGHAGLGANITRDILNRHHQSREFVDKVYGIVDDHMKLHEAAKMKLSTRKKLYAKPYFEDLLELNRLDCLGSHSNLDGYNFVRMDYLSMPKEVAKPIPFVMGRDLIALGYKPCGEFKAVLEELEIAQLENQVQNRDEALALAKVLAEKMIRKSA